jgi:hypothetical protein
METHHVPGAVCPVCSKLLDGATNINDDGAPKPGDVSVCVDCMSILTFTPDLKLRLMTQGEVQALPEPNKAAVIKATRLVQFIRGINRGVKDAGRSG